MQPERDYESLLESVADGTEIDWGALDASAATSAERTRYRNLRLVARVAALHRTLVLDDEVPSPLTLVNESTSGDPGAWGHLTIKSRIASGAFGRIYRAHDSQLNRDVALKLLRGDITLLRPVERVLAEARTLARVDHQNVVTVHGADVRDGRAGCGWNSSRARLWTRGSVPTGRWALARPRRSGSICVERSPRCTAPDWFMATSKRKT
jgi:hypothetical protein